MIKRLTVLDMVAAALRAGGYDGLTDGDCACEIDDLMPCSTEVCGCEGGHKIPCDPDDCDADGECDWHIMAGPRRPELDACSCTPEHHPGLGRRLCPRCTAERIASWAAISEVPGS